MGVAHQFKEGGRGELGERGVHKTGCTSDEEEEQEGSTHPVCLSPQIHPSQVSESVGVSIQCPSLLGEGGSAAPPTIVN